MGSPDGILISLGTNDFNLGIGPLPERDEFVSTYVEFVERLLSLYPDAEIALTEGAIVNDAADPTRPQRSVLNSYIADTVERLADARVHQVLSQYNPATTVMRIRLGSSTRPWRASCCLLSPRC